MEQTKKRLIISLVLLAAFVVCGIAVEFGNFSFPCVIRSSLGVFCPTCGVTTAVGFLFDLRVIESFIQNPLPVLIAGWLIVLVVFNLYCFIKKQDRALNFLIPAIAVCVCLVVALVIKNFLNILM